MNAVPPPSARPILFAADVAEVFSAAAGKPIKVSTVWSYLEKSKPADPTTGRKAGRYADNPVPAPTGYTSPGRGGNRPYWLPHADQTMSDLVQELHDWWANKAADQTSATDRSRRSAR